MESWRTPLCSCANHKTCLATWFCCCSCTHGRTTNRLRHYPAEPSPETLDSPNTQCFLIACAFFTPVGIAPSICLQRRDIRTKLDIPGNMCEDLTISCCCPCCAIVQHETEVRDRARQGPQADSSPQYRNTEHAMEYVSVRELATGTPAQTVAA
jgi:Cys-rich protein (TIGR01571 family)